MLTDKCNIVAFVDTPLLLNNNNNNLKINLKYFMQYLASETKTTKYAEKFTYDLIA